jgi:hypothetical protein
MVVSFETVSKCRLRVNMAIDGTLPEGFSASDYQYQLYFAARNPEGTPESGLFGLLHVYSAIIADSGLPNTRRSSLNHITIDFPMEDFGKEAIFAVRLVTRRGRRGPGGRVFSTFIT